MALGLVLVLIGVAVHLTGTRWLNAVLPPVVTGAVVALIGFNLAPAAKDNFEKGPVVGLVTLVLLVATLAFFRGIIGRLAIFLAVVLGYFLAWRLGDVDEEARAAIDAAAWVGLPDFQTPTFSLAVLPLFLPAVIALIAENIGHVKSVGQMTDTDTDPLMGRAIAADGVATTLAGLGGGSATTTYAENIGVMAATRIYSTAAYWVAAISHRAGDVPEDRRADLRDPAWCAGRRDDRAVRVGRRAGHPDLADQSRGLQPADQPDDRCHPLIIGIADFTWVVGDLTFTGIALGSIAALIIYHGMKLLGFRTRDHDELVEERGALDENRATPARSKDAPTGDTSPFQP